MPLLFKPTISRKNWVDAKLVLDQMATLALDYLDGYMESLDNNKAWKLATIERLGWTGREILFPELSRLMQDTVDRLETAQGEDLIDNFNTACFGLLLYADLIYQIHSQEPVSDEDKDADMELGENTTAMLAGLIVPELLDDYFKVPKCDPSLN